MKNKIAIPPGVFDILPASEQELWKSSHLWQFVEMTARKTAADFGYEEVRTPLFERTELFKRSVGETTDIVTKEMYTFEDKGKRSMTLRPEGTASVIRAVVENQLATPSSQLKLFYLAPMFRYERAQAGRYRQHHQFGVEAIGSPSPKQDAELIDLLWTLYTRLGLKNLSLNINSIGKKEARLTFRQELKEYLTPHLSKLSEDSQRRLETNPLRIVDSKDPSDQEIVANAPSILDFLDESSRQHFSLLKEYLEALNIPYKVNPLLVRGLDYYNETVFEIVAGELGAQNSIGGGGRYDGLMEELGGPNLPSIGFGTGIERIIQTLINQGVSLPKRARPLLYIIPLGEPAAKQSFELLHQLRQEGIPAQMEFSDRKVGKALQAADQLGARYAAVIGDNELEQNLIELKELATGVKTSLPFSDLSYFLKKNKMD
ncbi:MAG: histidine--tRNA ligase [Parachlamydia sp.]|jgi:histidyl-tRNA synthetase|nr:histidine--tRNA ligase [Parachlamydia sp.]